MGGFSNVLAQQSGISFTHEDFCKAFTFNPELHGHIALELEFFFVDVDTRVFTSASPRIMPILQSEKASFFSPELSQFQGELKTGPCKDLDDLLQQTHALISFARKKARRIGLDIVFDSLGPEDLPIRIYPDDRYDRIARGKDDEQLKAASRVAAFHFHQDTGGIENAIRIHNVLVENFERLVMLGDRSNGKRLAIYKEMAGSLWKAPEIDCSRHLHEYLEEFVFPEARAFEGENTSIAQLAKSWWALLRLHFLCGTHETRVADTTEDIDAIAEFVKACLRLRKDALG